MLMVTPQFAAGAGIVIAAMLAVDVPHAALTYGPNPPVRECAEQACANPKPAPGGLATSKPSIKLKQAHRKAAHRKAAPPKAAPPKAAPPKAAPPKAAVTAPKHAPAIPHSRRRVVIEYRTIRAQASGFIALITIKGPGKPGAWTLTLTFADAQVQHVWGAQWQPDSTRDGGVATGQPGGWLPGQNTGTSKIVIIATGHPSTPSSCSFDGASCRFG
jgi:hypothetical protein